MEIQMIRDGDMHTHENGYTRGVRVYGVYMKGCRGVYGCICHMT